MKKKNILQLMGCADEKYITEADPTAASKPKIRKKTKLLLLAACFMTLITAAGLVLFIPFKTKMTDVSKYRDSEYYQLIGKLNELNYEPPEYKNNYDRLTSSIKNIFAAKNKSSNVALGSDSNILYDAKPESVNEANGTSQYEEVTDNQVEGITEADRIKRSDSHIFYLDGTVLKIFKTAKENTFITDSYDIASVSEPDAEIRECGFFLSSDCKTATVIARQYPSNKPKNIDAETQYIVSDCCYMRPEIIIISLDVSNTNNIVLNKKITVSGDYVTSRTVNGSLLLIASHHIDKNNVNFDDLTSFIPHIEYNGDCRVIRPDDIVIPETLDSSGYTTVWKLDEKTFESKGETAYLSYSREVYVSHDNIYLTHTYKDTANKNNNDYTETTITEISILSYADDKFEQKGKVKINGYLKDQYSMDEKDGVLRVAATLDSTLYEDCEMYYCSEHKAYHHYGRNIERNTNASLYCIDISSKQIIAEVTAFAPDGETVKSVRFDGDNAYVCTSIELTDPVFFFDLSDMNNITYKETGTIEGFSTSLINMGNGYLLGIGRGSGWDKVKVEVYRETDNGVVSVCSYEPTGSVYYSVDYKSYFIDREKGLFGFGLFRSSESDNGKQLYVLLHFDGEKLTERIFTELNGSPDEKRGVLADGYMYIFGADDFKVFKIQN